MDGMDGYLGSFEGSHARAEEIPREREGELACAENLRIPGALGL